jgi:hypothetical protein
MLIQKLAKVKNNMGKTLPTPYPGQSLEDYKNQLISFKKNYWKFLNPLSKSKSKSGGREIPLPPEHLRPKKE